MSINDSQQVINSQDGDLSRLEIVNPKLEDTESKETLGVEEKLAEKRPQTF
jgi:hypothetical protein